VFFVGQDEMWKFLNMYHDDSATSRLFNSLLFECNFSEMALGWLTWEQEILSLHLDVLSSKQ